MQMLITCMPSLGSYAFCAMTVHTLDHCPDLILTYYSPFSNQGNSELTWCHWRVWLLSNGPLKDVSSMFYGFGVRKPCRPVHNLDSFLLQELNTYPGSVGTSIFLQKMMFSHMAAANGLRTGCTENIPVNLSIHIESVKGVYMCTPIIANFSTHHNWPSSEPVNLDHITRIKMLSWSSPDSHTSVITI